MCRGPVRVLVRAHGAFAVHADFRVSGARRGRGPVLAGGCFSARPVRVLVRARVPLCACASVGPRRQKKRPSLCVGCAVVPSNRAGGLAEVRIKNAVRVLRAAHRTREGRGARVAPVLYFFFLQCRFLEPFFRVVVRAVVFARAAHWPIAAHPLRPLSPPDPAPSRVGRVGESPSKRRIPSLPTLSSGLWETRGACAPPPLPPHCRRWRGPGMDGAAHPRLPPLVRRRPEGPPQRHPGGEEERPHRPSPFPGIFQERRPRLCLSPLQRRSRSKRGAQGLRIARGVRVAHWPCSPVSVHHLDVADWCYPPLFST
jgi:hypothetical protein